VVDDVLDSVETLLDGKGVLVVDRAEEGGGFSGGEEIGGVGETDGEGMNLRPGGEGGFTGDWIGRWRIKSAACTGDERKKKVELTISVWGRSSRRTLLQSHLPSLKLSMGNLLRLLDRNRSDQTRVQPSTQQHTVRDLAHQPLLDGRLQALPQLLQVGIPLGDVLLSLLVSVPPRRLEVSLRLLGGGVVDVTGGEGEHDVALLVEGLELGGKVDGFGRGGVPALVEGSDTDGISGGDDSRGGDGGVEEDEGEHAVEFRAEVRAVLLVL
jgi:hypothetical protein